MKSLELDPRLSRILTFVVESHVSSAEPVGSQYVRAAYHLSISPATIRNAMRELEELGLLRHPHTSAGRVPTEAGYRYYVDHLMRPEPIPIGMRRALDGAADRARLESRSGDLPPTLARASRQLAMMAMRSREDESVDRVNFAALEGGLVVVAVGVRDGGVATATWRPRTAPPAAVLRRAEAWVRERLPVAGPSGLDALARAAGAGAPPDAAPFVEEALAEASRLLATREMPAVRVDGADNIASQPEFQGPGQLRPLVSLLANQESLARTLDAFSGEVTPRVAIGSEIASPEMRACAIVGMGVVVGGMRGVIGVMGPVRMPYRRVVSLVVYVGGRLLGAST
ncbi:MAG TPA: heat-inducible transcriptional repressor HrcA [Candidatus Limnocylindrales bacterium]|nr:heat-inducible transcriptional repressor HrcA [Candidatus Limnocylindrales bacterium]